MARFHRAGTGQGPFDVVLSAVLDAAQEKQGTPAASERPPSTARPRLRPCRPGPRSAASAGGRGQRGQRAERAEGHARAGLRGACGRLPDACRAAQAAGPLPCPLPLPARRPHHAPHHAGQSDKATLLQASWKRRSVQGKFQSAVGELMEINGLIEGIADKEKDLEERQNFTALKIEKAMKIAEMEEPPPKMPTDREMADPKKMQATPPTDPPTHLPTYTHPPTHPTPTPP